MLRFFVPIFFLFNSTFSFGAIKISEAYLIELSKKKAPKLDGIRAAFLNVDYQKDLIEEKYAPEAFGKGAYSETNERPVIEFLPVFSPVKIAQLGLRQKFSNGFQTEALASTDQRSAASSLSGNYNNVTTTILSFTVQMDLWRDLFGRVSSKERENAKLLTEKAKIEEGIETRAFEIGLRKTFWSLVANQEQLKFAERLKNTAREQVEDAKNRLRNSIGDSGEVARYEAQLALRMGQVIFLTYQKEALVKQLKTLLPELGHEDLELGSYDIDKTIDQVVQCSALIVGHSKVPYEFTLYDEMVRLFREVKTNQRTINDRYSDIDLQLYGTVKTTGVGSEKLSNTEYRGSYADSVHDMTSYNRSGHEAGVRFTMPLGAAKRNTRDTKILYDNKRLDASIDEADARVVSTHTQLAKSLALLKDVISTQKMNTRALEKRLQVIRKKYSQARINVTDLILDQDALFNSEITTVDAQLQVLNVLFDYLVIFTETPCPFNRI